MARLTSLATERRAPLGARPLLWRVRTQHTACHGLATPRSRPVSGARQSRTSTLNSTTPHRCRKSAAWLRDGNPIAAPFSATHPRSPHTMWNFPPCEPTTLAPAPASTASLNSSLLSAKARCPVVLTSDGQPSQSQHPRPQPIHITRGSNPRIHGHLRRPNQHPRLGKSHNSEFSGRQD